MKLCHLNYALVCGIGAIVFITVSAQNDFEGPANPEAVGASGKDVFSGSEKSQK